MIMRKILTILITVILVGAAVSVSSFADGKESVWVSVSISNGSIMSAQQQVNVTDSDADGVLSINDALFAAHEAAYPGGAEAGFSSGLTEYGISLTKLWGVENGGGYSYYVNDVSPLSLGDAIKTGDNISAFVFTDTTAYSDVYSFFDVKSVDLKNSSELTLTLSMMGFDENWNPLTKPVEGAEITVNGKKADLKTDENGKVTIKSEELSEGIISAVSDKMILVPPVCFVSDSENDTEKTVTPSDKKDESSDKKDEISDDKDESPQIKNEADDKSDEKKPENDVPPSDKNEQKKTQESPNPKTADNNGIVLAFILILLTAPLGIKLCFAKNNKK